MLKNSDKLICTYVGSDVSFLKIFSKMKNVRHLSVVRLLLADWLVSWEGLGFCLFVFIVLTIFLPPFVFNSRFSIGQRGESGNLNIFFQL